MSITAATPAGLVSLESQQQAASGWPARPGDPSHANRTGFGDPVALRLSAEARVASTTNAEDPAPDRNEPLGAVEERLRDFREEVARMLVQRGMSMGEAADASGILAAAVGDAARKPEIQDQLSNLTERVPDLAARASLVVEEAVVRWDPATQSFVSSVQRVAVSVDLQNGYVVPRGGQADASDPSRRIAVFKVDAVLPLNAGTG